MAKTISQYKIDEDGNRKLKSSAEKMKDFAGMSITLLKTDKRAHELFLKADELGLLTKGLTDKQKMSFKLIPRCYEKSTSTSWVSSSDLKTNKAFRLVTSGHHRLPVQQSSDTSRLVVELRQDFVVAERKLQALKQDSKARLIPYFVTLTLPNAGKGELKERVSEIMSAFSQLQRALKDGAKRKNGLKLVALDDDGEVLYRGGLRALEVAISEERLLNSTTENLYNQHIHFLLLADGELNEEATAERIFTKWQAINPQYKLSREAFDLRSAYMNEKAEDGQDLIVSALQELLKYEVKPQIYKAFCATDSRFSVEVFAELQNALRGRQTKARQGILKDAYAFNKEFKDYGNAMAFSESETFPDVYTQKVEIDRQGHIEKNDLSEEELLYRNRGSIENAVLSAESVSLLEEVEACATDETEIENLGLLLSFRYAKSVDTFIGRLEIFGRGIYDENTNSYRQTSKSQDIEMLLDCINMNMVDGRCSVKNYGKEDKEIMLKQVKEAYAELYPVAGRSLETEELFEKACSYLRLTVADSSEKVDISLHAKEMDARFFAKHFPSAWGSYREKVREELRGSYADNFPQSGIDFIVDLYEENAEAVLQVNC